MQTLECLFKYFSSVYEFSKIEKQKNIFMNSGNCPAGLEYLLHVDRLFIKQQTEIMEVFTGIETANKYQVRTHPKFGWVITYDS